ncbi:MAG: NAD(P)/FAD-dependent oxidoreductase, partial [Deltaproteobacteria bacterium]|nr:NAD(P)/FAD-dependent oxidoreductase [Deltaproteobacteria bacterium]
IAAAMLNVYRWPRRNFKALEVITLVFFAAHFVSTVFLGLSFFVVHGPVLSNVTLAAMAWGTLLAGSPFTSQYARDDWDESYWDDPSFLRINGIITAVWGVVFTANAAMSVMATWLDLAEGVRSWLLVILPNVGIALAIVFSVRFPDLAVRTELQKHIEAMNPFKWTGPDFKAVRPEGANRHDVIVIGSGIGGLTAAALLAKRGLKVAVFEQHYQAGGFCSSWTRVVKRGDERLRYTFDAGVHDVSGLGDHGPVRNLLKQLDIQDVIDWRHMGHEYRLEGLQLQVPPDCPDGFQRMLAERFPNERDKIQEFFDIVRSVYREMYDGVEKTGGVPRPPETVEALLDYPKTHPHSLKWGETPYRTMLDRFFQDDQLKEVLLALTGYLGDDPKALSFEDMVPIFGYYFDGGYYPVGGSQTLAKALVKVIEDNGGSVQLKTAVTRILVEKNRAIGVTTNEERHLAEAIVANSDVRKTFLELVGPEHLPDGFVHDIEALRSSTSAFIVTLGIDCVPDIAPITIVDEVCIATPSLVDPGLAPAGHAAVELLKLVPRQETASWDPRNPEYEGLKRRCGDELIDAAEKVITN